MESNISINGTPCIWITVDEDIDGHWSSMPSDCKDYLIPADKFDGSVPSDYWPMPPNPLR